jgi:spore maturation protein CgeB
VELGITNETWLRNLYEPLIDLGHDVYLLKIEELELLNKYNNLTHLIEKVFEFENKRKKFDLFFSYLMEGMVDPLLIKYISDCGVISCNFSCNNIHQFNLVENLSKFYDFNLFSEKYAKEKFDSIGVNSIWWPMASNPKYFKPINIERKYDATFVGANYSNRFSYLSSLLQSNIDVHVFGPGWAHFKKNHLKYFLKRQYLLLKSIKSFSNYQKYESSLELSDFDKQYYFINNYFKNFHLPVSDIDQISLYSSSNISLGFLDVYENHSIANTMLQHLHLREFEAPMSGALYLTGYSEELSEMFIPEKEVLTYRNTFELVDKTKFYLKNPKISEKVRLAARNRALSHHTYHSRFSQLFKEIGL